MRLRFAFSLALLSLFPAFVSATACSRQSEGERCNALNGDDDCDNDSLVCTPAITLRNNDEIDRCCPSERENYTDDRCAPRSAGVGDGDGDGGAGGESAGGPGGMDGDDDLLQRGDACFYTSNCTPPLVCGPTGVCQDECNTSRDCPSGQKCNNEKVCVEE